MVGVSLVASIIDELTTERTRQQLELAHPAAPTQEVANAA
jgi:hypothetical protein